MLIFLSAYAGCAWRFGTDSYWLATCRKKSYQPSLTKKNQKLLSGTANCCYEQELTP